MKLLCRCHSHSPVPSQQRLSLTLQTSSSSTSLGRAMPQFPPHSSSPCSGPPQSRRELCAPQAPQPPLLALFAARGAHPAWEPRHRAHLHHQPRGHAGECGKGHPRGTGPSGDPVGPPRHPTSPLLCPLQLPTATARCKRWRPQVERGSQASPKVLKLEHNTTADPSEPSSTQRDSRGEPSTSATSHNCSSVPKAGRSHADDAGGKQGWSPPPQIYGGFPLFSQPLGTPVYSGPWPNPTGAEKGKQDPMGWGWAQPRVLPSTSKNQARGMARASN